jgi:hypothetical protein
MENVLDIYKRPYSADFPLVCMDESPKQLIKETRAPIKMQKGKDKKSDYEYERCGVCNIFIANEPLKGKRVVKVTERKTKKDWAQFIKELADIHYKDAKKITLVMDNLNTHKAASLYETFKPEEAKRIWNKFDFVFTPKHGSWLNMAEIELNVLNSQCLNRRIHDIKIIKDETEAWASFRNNINSKINWRFQTEDARIKLQKLYPTIKT